MPWVYTLRLSYNVNASKIHNDWENTISGSATIQNDHGGVTVVGQRAVIVSTRNSPSYQDMTNLDYVESIAEKKEIPSRGTSNFNPPIELGHGIELRE